MSRYARYLFLFLVCTFGFSASVFAGDEIIIEIKNHWFSPSEITIPEGKKVKLLVKNLDPTPEEFESHSLHREKVIPGKGQAIIHIGPLKPGVYEFIGEFNRRSAKGRVIVK